MRELPNPDHRIDAKALDAFLGNQVGSLTQELRPVIDAARRGISSPSRLRRGSLLYHEINRPNIVGDSVSLPLIEFLQHVGLRVYSEVLPDGNLGAYDGSSVRYTPELKGILKASVLAHEASHHFARHIPHDPPDDGQEAIAESAALIALRFFNIDTGSISLPDMERYIAGTGETNGFSLWRPNEEGVPMGMVQAAETARKVIMAIAEGRRFFGIPNI